MTIRRLPPHMRRASERFARDFKSSGKVAAGRIDGLRDILGREFSLLVVAAVHGAGPQKIKDINGGSFEAHRRRIHDVLDKTAKFYGLQIGRK